MLKIESVAKALIISIKVVPGASRTRLMGEWQGCARVAVSAPPEKGKANKELLDFLAKKLGLRKGNLEIIAGQTSPVKKIRLMGISTSTIREALM